MDFNVLIEQDEDGIYVARVPELEGCYTQGKTLENLLERSYKTFGYPVTPLLFILGNVWIIYFSLIRRPVCSLFGLGTIALGILIYFYFRRRKTL